MTPICLAHYEQLSMLYATSTTNLDNPNSIHELHAYSFCLRVQVQKELDLSFNYLVISPVILLKYRSFASPESNKNHLNMSRTYELNTFFSSFLNFKSSLNFCFELDHLLPSISPYYKVLH